MQNETGFWDTWNTRARVAAEVDPQILALWDAVYREVVALPVRAPRVVEIGCGTGGFAERLPASTSDGYLGIDLSPQAIEVARARVPGRRFVDADVLQWTGNGQHFDLAIVIDTVAYFRDQDEAMQRVTSMLVPGGYVVLTTGQPVRVLAAELDRTT